MRALRSRSVAPVLVVVAVVGAAPVAGFEIEAILGSPFPSQLVASPAGDRLAWSPDRALLAYVVGGVRNSAGELPNPLSVPTGVERAVWVLDVPGGSARRRGYVAGVAEIRSCRPAMMPAAPETMSSRMSSAGRISLRRPEAWPAAFISRSSRPPWRIE